MKTTNPTLSRREFLKLSLASLWGLILAACGAAKADNNEPAATATATATASPTSTMTATSTHTPTSTPTETPIPCFSLLDPPNGAKLGMSGRVTFAWTEQFGASAYKLVITLPNGYVEEKTLQAARFERYLESLPLAGEYHWQVTALDGSGQEVCLAGPWTFTKEKYIKPGGGDGGGDSTTSGAAGPGGGAPGGGQPGT